MLSKANDLFSRLTLKGTKFYTEGAASDVLIDELWDAIQEIDSTGMYIYIKLYRMKQYFLWHLK